MQSHFTEMVSLQTRLLRDQLQYYHVDARARATDRSFLFLTVTLTRRAYYPRSFDRIALAVARMILSEID